MSDRNIKILAVTLLLAILFLVAFLLVDYQIKSRNVIQENDKTKIVDDNHNQSGWLRSKDPEEFMAKVKEKAQENQKNYDSSLAEFAEKKWEKMFIDQNSFNDAFLADNVKILNREIIKDDNGSTLFKIKYRLESDGSGQENEDYFFLVISEQKLKELGITDLKSNIFLSEDEIRRNILREGFAKITKIQKI